MHRLRDHSTTTSMHPSPPTMKSPIHHRRHHHNRLLLRRCSSNPTLEGSATRVAEADDLLFSEAEGSFLSYSQGQWFRPCCKSKSASTISLWTHDETSRTRENGHIILSRYLHSLPMKSFPSRRRVANYLRRLHRHMIVHLTIPKRKENEVWSVK